MYFYSDNLNVSVEACSFANNFAEVVKKIVSFTDGIMKRGC